MPVIFNPFNGDLILVPIDDVGTGDVVGPASSTDNTLARFDGITGNLLQNSQASLTDGGRLTLTTDGTGTTEFNALTLNTTTGGRPRIDLGTSDAALIRQNNFNLLYLDGLNETVYLNNMLVVGTDFTISNSLLNKQNGGFIQVRNNGSSNTAFTFEGSVGSNDWKAINEIIINKAGNRGLIIKGIVSQTANLSEHRDSTDAVLNYVAANGGIQADAGFGAKRRTTAISVAAIATDYIIGVTDNSVARTITLPAANTLRNGQMLIIKDEAGTAASANNITIARAGADTIDGATSLTISANYGIAKLYSNGSNAFFTM